MIYLGKMVSFGSENFDMHYWRWTKGVYLQILYLWLRMGSAFLRFCHTIWQYWKIQILITEQVENLREISNRNLWLWNKININKI